VINPTQKPLPDNTQRPRCTDIHAPGEIRTRNPTKRAAADLRLRPRGTGICHYMLTSISSLEAYRHITQLHGQKHLDCGFESHRSMDVCRSVVNVVCCQVEVSAKAGASSREVLPQIIYSPTVSGVSECDREVSKMRRLRPRKKKIRGCLHSCRRLVTFSTLSENNKVLYIRLV
jgi:hypothetical protein